MIETIKKYMEPNRKIRTAELGFLILYLAALGPEDI